MGAGPGAVLAVVAVEVSRTSSLNKCFHVSCFRKIIVQMFNVLKDCL